MSEKREREEVCVCMEQGRVEGAVRAALRHAMAGEDCGRAGPEKQSPDDDWLTRWAVTARKIDACCACARWPRDQCDVLLSVAEASDEPDIKVRCDWLIVLIVLIGWF